MSDLSFLEEDDNINMNVADEVGKILDLLITKRKAVAEAEEVLKALKDDELQLVRVTIPQIFKKNRIDDISLSNGVHVATKEEITCQLIKDEERRKQAFAWLTDNGGESLIKDVLTIDSPSLPLIDVLNKGGVVYSITKDVNVNSLKAWFREKLGMKRGVIATLEQSSVPKEFGLFTYDIATIKEPKGGVL